MSLYEYGSDASGLCFTIDAVANGSGGTNFTVHVLTGSLNLNAVYWSDGDSTKEGTLIDFTGAKSENSLNMNGANVVWNDDGTSTIAKEVYDGGIKLSDAGLGHGTDTYLTANGTDYSFTVANLDLSLFATIGVRATSTSTAEGSIKWVDDDPVEPPTELAFDGLSSNAWRSFNKDGTPDGNGDWSQTSYLTTNSYETAFGINSISSDDNVNANVDGMSLLDVMGKKSAALPEGDTLQRCSNSDSAGESFSIATTRASSPLWSSRNLAHSSAKALPIASAGDASRDFKVCLTSC